MAEECICLQCRIAGKGRAFLASELLTVDDAMGPAGSSLICIYGHDHVSGKCKPQLQVDSVALPEAPLYCLSASPSILILVIALEQTTSCPTAPAVQELGVVENECSMAASYTPRSTSSCADLLPPRAAV